MENKKICKKCGVEKALSDFYAHKRMKDGRLNICKECKKSYSRELDLKKREDPSWVESERARHRGKYHRLNYRLKHKPSKEDKKKYMEKYMKKFHERIAAKNATSKIKTDGEKHHWSYKNEHLLDFIELTTSDHAKLHRFLVYDQENMQYRTKVKVGDFDEDLLLNSRLIHESFLKLVLLDNQ